jgi:hypothetical protein
MSPGGLANAFKNSQHLNETKDITRQKGESNEEQRRAMKSNEELRKAMESNEGNDGN